MPHVFSINQRFGLYNPESLKLQIKVLNTAVKKNK